METMEIPNEFISLGVGLVGALAGRSIYNLIDRNKTDSDNADIKGDIKIAEIDSLIRNVDNKYREIDREQYQQIGEVREVQAHDKGYRQGRVDMLAEINAKGEK